MPTMEKSMTNRLDAATLAQHGDRLPHDSTDVAPPIHLSTTFRYTDDVDDLKPTPDEDQPTEYVYSRVSAPNSTRLETLLSTVLSGSSPDDTNKVHVLTYASGLAAFFAILTQFKPRNIAISGGYHGCHGVIDIHTKLSGLKRVDLHAEDAAWDAAGLGAGDIVHLETPINPTGEAFSIAAFAERAHRRGAILTVDSTLGPPGLQDPLALGADVVMHSGTKYIGGHSDMLCGVVACKKEEWHRAMFAERIYLGSVMGSFEGWLGVRSVRTMQLRIAAQSRNATRLVRWIADRLKAGGEREEEVVARAVVGVKHASLQVEDQEWLAKQMPGGFGPVFAIYMKETKLAKTLPSRLKLFHHATSLGGVESLVEWRRMSDANADEKLLRFSIGVENWEDLRDDLLNGLRSLESML